MTTNEPRPFTAKQASFVQYYTDCTNKQTFNNATQAAIAAGYSAKTANNMVNRLLGNVGIKSAIIAITAKRQAEIGYNQQKAYEYLEEQRIKANENNDVMASVAVIREMNTIFALRTENINSRASEAPEPLSEEERAVLKRLAIATTNSAPKGITSWTTTGLAKVS